MRFIGTKMVELSVADALESDKVKGREFERDSRLLRLAYDCPIDVEQLFGEEINAAVAGKDWAL